jgi:hypothetical protein
MQSLSILFGKITEEVTVGWELFIDYITECKERLTPYR